MGKMENEIVDEVQEVVVMLKEVEDENEEGDQSLTK